MSVIITIREGETEGERERAREAIIYLSSRFSVQQHTNVIRAHCFIHSDYFSTDTLSEFHAEAPQVTARKGSAQCPYVAVTAGFEPTTFRTKGDEYTNKPPCPKYLYDR